MSVGVHAALLTVRFVDPEGFNRIFQDTPLEVILVNSRSGEAPTKAQAIAQANLAGGGEAEKGRATSPLPPSTLFEVGDAPERRAPQDRQAAGGAAAAAGADAARAGAAAAARSAARGRRPAGGRAGRAPPPAGRLLAEIEKRINEENARPKKRYISPATREEVYAIYYDALRRKIEDRGTRNFPEYRGRSCTAS